MHSGSAGIIAVCYQFQNCDLGIIHDLPYVIVKKMFTEFELIMLEPCLRSAMSILAGIQDHFIARSLDHDAALLAQIRWLGMLLTITNTQRPATDLGYLLHKNPDRVQSFELSFGKAHVLYPEATPERCTAALLLDVDPVALVRTRRGPSGDGGTLDQYVNDRPYVASSFLSVAIARVLSSALAGASKGRPEM